MGNGSGVSRGDRNRNARLERLRRLVPVSNAIAGIDLAGSKQMVVVTRLPPGGVCHVAYVDIAANPNADELAHKAADDAVRKFDCAKDKVRIEGTPGRATELAQ